MKLPLYATAACVTALGLSRSLTAQVCYDNRNQCYMFAPPWQEASKLEAGDIRLFSNRLSVTGDIRARVRGATTTTTAQYNDADQVATRARVRLAFEATENALAFVEFNFSETWAGSESYSDALQGENFNGIWQAYFDVDDLLGFEDNWRVGRSEYVLANGMILGSCDFLQRPATFTGAWLGRNFGGHDFEIFMMDDYGPGQFQAANPGDGGVRYVGGTAKIVICGDDGDAPASGGEATGAEGTTAQEPADRPSGFGGYGAQGSHRRDGRGLLDKVIPYVLFGTGDGDRTSDDWWAGVDATGRLPLELDWSVEWARRDVDGGSDINAWRAIVSKTLDLFDGVFYGFSYTFTDSEGAMHINPADFNTAGLLHEYAGAWRSDLQTNQLRLEFDPGADIHVDLTALTFDARGATPRLGNYEFDLTARTELVSGVHVFAGYGIDNDERQVFYFQTQLFF